MDCKEQSEAVQLNIVYNKLVCIRFLEKLLSFLRLKLLT